MRIDEFIKKVAQESKLSQAEARRVVKQTLDALVDVAVSGDRLIIPGFGTIRSRQQSARTMRNIKTNEKMQVPAKRVPYFKFANSVREKVAKAAN